MDTEAKFAFRILFIHLLRNSFICYFPLLFSHETGNIKNCLMHSSSPSPYLFLYVNKFLYIRQQAKNKYSGLVLMDDSDLRPGSTSLHIITQHLFT